MCLGESTTQNQYPKFLEQALNRRDIGIHFSVIDKGLAGTNTSLILSRMESYLAEYHPNMVVAMMGINEAFDQPSGELSKTAKGMPGMRSLRIFKLTKLLWRNLLAKAKGEGFYKPEKKKLSSAEIRTYPSRIREREHRAQPISKKGSSEVAIELPPKNSFPSVELGRFYQDQGKVSLAEDTYKKALELNPNNDSIFLELARVYRNQGKFLQATDAYKKALALNPNNDIVYLELGRVYKDQGKVSQTEDLFKEALKRKPENPRLWRAMTWFYQETGRPEIAKEYAAKIERARFQPYNPVTVRNYRKLKEILDGKGIKLVCVQYPVRNVAPLKELFEKTEDLIFVDNENIFKEAMKKVGSKEYFKDMFGGDFGHCTQKGNKLLAQNIAVVILQEAFHK